MQNMSPQNLSTNGIKAFGWAQKAQLILLKVAALWETGLFSISIYTKKETRAQKIKTNIELIVFF